MPQVLLHDLPYKAADTCAMDESQVRELRKAWLITAALISAGLIAMPSTSLEGDDLAGLNHIVLTVQNALLLAGGVPFRNVPLAHE